MDRKGDGKFASLSIDSEGMVPARTGSMGRSRSRKAELETGDSMEPRMDLAANLRRLRKEKCWSQEMLAHFAGLHPTEVSRLERGLREPRLRTVMQVASALNVSIQELVGPPEVPAAAESV
jgi:DNA-binding XRE family transcriptional regulator